MNADSQSITGAHSCSVPPMFYREVPIAPTITSGRTAHAERLTRRIREAVYLISIGKTYAEAAEIMNVARYSVTRYINRAKDSTECSTTAGLIGYAIRKGIIA